MQALRGHPWHMVILIVGMLLCLLLAVAVVGLVAIPARREGRDLLTPKGEEVVSRVRERTGSAMDAARDKVAEVTTSKDEVTSPKDD
jgi:hypothetical protein